MPEKMYIVHAHIVKGTKNDELMILILLPATILSTVSTALSANGPLTVLYSSIPGVAGLTIYVLDNPAMQGQKVVAKLLLIIVIITPLFCSTIIHDWKFTFFDIRPAQMNTTIVNGFGKGIKTNELYGKLYEWVGNNAKTFAGPDDFLLSYVESSMTHMITKLRPSLNDSFITNEMPDSYYKNAIESMEKRGRNPKIAFIFERMPTLFPVFIEKGIVDFPDKQFDFISSQDPISIYVRTHMTIKGAFKISDDHIILCYVDKNLPKNHKAG